ncbi:hypothetical protein SMF913_11432 [Streptomyces malaysiensis]|uniref:Uncharacterized protein n=1 Tax=Streptomyces malaysiensis TaxID=92644 RepID=A0A2J7Z563_STRMQ|nr:hypothetical protein SMF913_11432 [Streptomyces malaysiensis]
MPRARPATTGINRPEAPGHGFTLVPVVGELLADLALTGTAAHPIELFDPRRLRLRRTS